MVGPSSVVMMVVRRFGIPLAVALFMIGFQSNVHDMTLESRAYPQLVMILLAAVLAVVGVKEARSHYRAPTADEEASTETLDSAATVTTIAEGQLPRLFGTMALTATFLLWGITALGFYTAAFLFSGATSRLVGMRSWLTATFFAAVLTFACYAVFSLAFNVRLPRGLLI